MKRKELIRILENSGCVFIRHGSKHDLYRNPNTGKQQPIPRHREILAAMEEGYYEVDLAGNFTFFNESFPRMTGYSSDKLMGSSYRQFYENPQEVFNTFNRVYQTGKPVTAADWPAITKDGRKIHKAAADQHDHGRPKRPETGQ